MHISFAEYFIDPDTNEKLKLEIISQKDGFVDKGFLKSSQNVYPIINGIPRFVNYKKENYSKSFGYQWQRWHNVQYESANIGKPMEGHTRRMWERITGERIKKMNLDKLLILDIGCGAGRFVDIAASKGAKVIGIDFSDAVNAAAKNFKNYNRVCICQADALKLPIRSNIIDGAYSIGVLHHTPDPEAGVLQVNRVLKDGGWFALNVYGKDGYYNLKSIRIWRMIFKIIWPVFQHYAPLVYAYIIVFVTYPFKYIPFLGNRIRKIFPFANLPDINWAILDTFDSITPSHASTHEGSEVKKWLQKSGFIEIKNSNWSKTSFSAYKSKKVIVNEKIK